MGAVALQVSHQDLHAQARWCASVADRLAGFGAPIDARTSWLGSAASVDDAHTQIFAAGIRCSFRMQMMAAKLFASATNYVENEANSAAKLRAL